MKEKLVKSYVFLGNLPIYRDNGRAGASTTEGCEFVINTRIKYELGVASMQFIVQNNPSVYNLDATNYPEIELDITALIRLKRLISSSGLDDDPTYFPGEHLLLSSTKLQKSQEYLKPCSVRIDSNGKVTFIIVRDKSQLRFDIGGKFQVLCLYDLIESIILHLTQSQISYDMLKNHIQPVSQTSHSFGTPPAPKPGAVPYVAPNAPPAMGYPPNIPAPIPVAPVIHVPAPSITTNVIPQMPIVPPAPIN